MGHVFAGTYHHGVTVGSTSDTPLLVTGAILNAAANGVGLLATGAIGWHITNAGTIEGAAHGVDVRNGKATVTNTGSISGGVFLEHGGTVFNTVGKTKGSGTIAAGVTVSGGLGTVVNTGRITTSGRNVVLSMGGVVTNGDASHRNAYLASSIIEAPAVAIGGAGGIVTNFGTIGSAVYLTGGTVINSGKIGWNVAFSDSSAAATLVNAGYIEAASFNSALAVVSNAGSVLSGIVVGSGLANIINSGQLGLPGASPYGLKLGGLASVLNTKSGKIYASAYPQTEIEGLPGCGVDMQAGGLLTNLGLIEGINSSPHEYADAVDLRDRGGVFNAGTIMSDHIGIELYSGGTVWNEGTIAGASSAAAVAFDGGDAHLVIGADAVFKGAVTATRGLHNVVELENGVHAGHLSGLGTSMTNFGQLLVDEGATWTLDQANTVTGGVGFTLDADASLMVRSLRVTGSVALYPDRTPYPEAQGTLTILAGGSGMEVGRKGDAGPGRLTIDKGLSIRGTGVIAGAIEDDGAIAATGGRLQLDGPVHGSGVISISSHALLVANGALGTTVQFVRNEIGGNLELGTSAVATGVIRGFGAAPARLIYLDGQTVTGLSYAATAAAAGVLTVSDTHGVLEKLRFAGGTYATSQFHHMSHSAGGSFITFQA